MGAKRFTEEQISDFLLQAKEGASNKFLCDKYDFSPSTLRRWKERHDESIRNKLKKIEYISATLFLCLIVSSLILAVVFAKSAGALCIPLMLVYCVCYIISFRKKSAEFIISENVFLSRSGRGASNAFYKFSWMLVIFFVFLILYAIINYTQLT